MEDIQSKRPLDYVSVAAMLFHFGIPTQITQTCVNVLCPGTFNVVTNILFKPNKTDPNIFFVQRSIHLSTSIKQTIIYNGPILAIPRKINYYLRGMTHSKKIKSFLPLLLNLTLSICSRSCCLEDYPKHCLLHLWTHQSA